MTITMTMTKKLQIGQRRARIYSSMEIEIVARQLDALGNPTRLAIYRTLVRAGDDGLPVGDLQRTVSTAASTLSHHLGRLIDEGLVTQERRATTLICRTHYPAMDALIGFLADECCADVRPKVLSDAMAP